MESLEEEKNTVKKPAVSIRMKVLNWAIFVVPSIATMFLSTYKSLGIEKAVMFKVFFSLPVILFILAFCAMIFYAQNHCYKNMANYDGTEESYVHASNSYQHLMYFNLIAPVLGAFIYPIFAKLGGKENVKALWGVLYASVLSGTLISTFFFSVWFELYSKWIGFLPLKKENVKFGIRQRVLVTLGLAVWGIFAGVMITVVITRRSTSLSNGTNFAGTFVLNWIPMMILSIGLTLLDVGIVVSSILSQLKKVYIMTEALASGDYTVEKLPIEGRDEIGHVIWNINGFYESTKKLLKGVQTNVDTTVQVGEELNSSMVQTSESVNEIVRNIGGLNEQMKSQSSLIDSTNTVAVDIMERIKKLDSSIENQSAGVEESSAAVRQMVANIESVNKILNKNMEQSEALDSASKVGQEKVADAANYAQKIMEESHSLLEASAVVRNIARQTNMLAMNASIEAAHAGKMGAGFSVVADEIRKLAEQSNEQGKNITESLKKLQVIIQGVADSTLEVQTQFKNIYDMTKVVGQQESVVVNAMAEQNEGSKQILEAMKNIDESTSVVLHESKEMLAGGKVVVSHMEKLNDTTTVIHDSLSEMSTGSNEILKAIKDVNDTSARSSEAIKGLSGEMSKFKL